MPKAVSIAVVVGVVAVVGGTLLVEKLSGPDSGEEIEVVGPDSGDEVNIYEEPTSPDSGDEIDTSDEPGGPDSGEEIDASLEDDEDDDTDSPTSPDSGEEVTLNGYLKDKAKGSCNVITTGSTCVEYIGSQWSVENAQLNCSGGGMYVNSPCPRPSIGGCRLGADTPNEIVTWHYDYGGDPFTQEVEPYAVGACTALSGAQWVE